MDLKSAKKWYLGGFFTILPSSDMTSVKKRISTFFNLLLYIPNFYCFVLDSFHNIDDHKPWNNISVIKMYTKCSQTTSNTPSGGPNVSYFEPFQWNNKITHFFHLFMTYVGQFNSDDHIPVPSTFFCECRDLKTCLRPIWPYRSLENCIWSSCCAQTSRSSLCRYQKSR